MIGQTDIMEYAQANQTFTARQMIYDLGARDTDFSLNTVMSCLRRMIENGVLQKVKRGIYSITDKGSKSFVAYYDNEMQNLNKLLSKKFPFLNYCIWSSEDIKHNSHYVVNMDIIFIDVEKEGIDAVFSTLMNTPDLKRQVFKTPTEEIFSDYIIGNSCIVVRHLISEAPVVVFGDGGKRTSIEKIMVDVSADQEFFFFQGYETLRFYRNIIDKYDINENRLLRYADRRSCKERIAEDLEYVKQNKIIA